MQAIIKLKWDILNIKQTGIRIPEVDMVYYKVKNIFGFYPYKWQAAIVKIETIVFIILPTIVLIKDQIDKWLILPKLPYFQWYFSLA